MAKYSGGGVPSADFVELIFVFFSVRFLEYFWLDFGSLLRSIVNDFQCFLHPFFDHEICIDFPSILERFLTSFSMVV